MKKALLFLTLFFIGAISLRGQTYPSSTQVGLAAARPTFCATPGQFYYATDTSILYVSTVAGSSCVWANSTGSSAVTVNGSPLVTPGTADFNNGTTAAAQIAFVNPGGGTVRGLIANLLNPGNPGSGVMTGTQTNPLLNDVWSYNGSGLWTNQTLGVPPFSITSSSAPILSAYRGNKIILSGSAAALTIAQANSAGFSANFYFDVWNLAPVPVTLTASTSYIGGGSTNVPLATAHVIIMNPGDTCHVSSDNTNYQANCSPLSTSFNSPFIDPRNPAFAYMGVPCKGDGTDSATAATACWQAAITYREANGGAVWCAAQTTWTLNRVGVSNGDTIIGPEGLSGCSISPSVDAAIVSATPTSVISGVTISNITFTGGSNPIDIPYITEGYFQNDNFYNNTGCGIAIVTGERRHFVHLTTSHTAANGFALLCTGDTTKSVFSGILTPSSTDFQDDDVVDGVTDVGGLNVGAGYYDSWLWWNAAQQGIQHTRANNIACRFSCLTGILHASNGTGNVGLEGDTFDVVTADHVGTSMSPEPKGIDIEGTMSATSFGEYNPIFTTNYQTISMYVAGLPVGYSMSANGYSTIHDSVFQYGDNSSTYGLYIDNLGADGTLSSDSGALYVNPSNTLRLAILSSNFSPNNVGTPIAFPSPITNTFVATDFTSANSAALQAITGLSWALGSAAVDYSFHCSLMYSQATPASGDEFGVGVITTAPTNVNANATVSTNTGAATPITTGALNGLTTTTPTAVVAFQPGSTGVYNATLDGTVEAAGSAAATFNLYVLNGTAADVIVIKRGSYCSLF